jgi:uncharacterized 2Fe-2S/4Fe-4S cluster protein (DUF4445 family)
MSTAGIDSDLITEAIIVGNSIMHHILFGLDYSSLIVEPFTTTYLEPMEVSGSTIGFDAISDVGCFSPSLIGSFVGSDAIALGISSGIFESHKTILAIDIGANTELLLSYDDRIVTTSAASGSAFEGSSLENGISYGPSAIYDIKIDDNLCDLSWKTLDDSTPDGICGTGAISALAEFVRREIINREGSFNRVVKSPRLVLDVAPPYFSITGDVQISQYDLRLLQQSKAAIRASIEVLLRNLKCDPENLEQLYLAGYFGYALDVSDAFDIDMFPMFENASIQRERFAANLGAEEILYSRPSREILNSLTSRIEHIDLSDNQQFEVLYLQSLKFSKASI